MDHIDNVVNSAGDIPADEALDINVAVIKQIQGQGRKHVFSTEDLKFKDQWLKSEIMITHVYLELLLLV